jgi:hypothetical protein
VSLAALEGTDTLTFDAQRLRDAPSGTVTFGVRWLGAAQTSRRTAAALIDDDDSDGLPAEEGESDDGDGGARRQQADAPSADASSSTRREAGVPHVHVGAPAVAAVPSGAPAASPRASAASTPRTASAQRLERRGTLEVYLRSAANLKAADRNGLSDPYAMIKLGGAKSWKKSSVKKKTLNPTWDERVTIECSLAEAVAGPLQLKMMDKDMLTSEKLGTLEVSLAALEGTDTLTFDAQRLRDAPSGTVTFGVRWLVAPLTSVDA